MLNIKAESKHFSCNIDIPEKSAQKFLEGIKRFHNKTIEYASGTQGMKKSKLRDAKRVYAAKELPLKVEIQKSTRL